MKRPALWILIFMICGIYCRLGISLLVCLVCIFLCIVCGSYIVIKTKRKGYLLLLLAFPLGSGGGKRSINLVYDSGYPVLPAADKFIETVRAMYEKTGCL